MSTSTRRRLAATTLLVAALAATGAAAPAWAGPAAVVGRAPAGLASSWVGGQPSESPGGPFTSVVAGAADLDTGFIGIRPDRTVVGWPTRYASAAVSFLQSGLTDVTSVALGKGVGVALRGDGSVVAWGQTLTGAETVPEDLGRVTAIAAGGRLAVHGYACGFVVAVRANGTVRAWGQTTVAGCNAPEFTAQANPPAGLKGVVSVSAGDSHALALRSNGTVVGWGYDTYGQASPPAGLDHVVQIAAGGYHSLALRDNGTVVEWGSEDDRYGVVPTLRNVVSLATGERGSVALLADGSTRTWGFDTPDFPNNGATLVPSSPGLSEVSVGVRQGVAITVPTAVGSPRIGPYADSDPVGQAEAFRATAPTSTTTTSLSVYLDAKSQANRVQVGLYSDAGGSPGTLLAAGTISDPTAGAWNAATVPATAVQAGQKYWLALLGPAKSGTVTFRDLKNSTGGASQTSAQTTLTSLPKTWKAGQSFTNAPASIYAAG